MVLNDIDCSVCERLYISDDLIKELATPSVYQAIIGVVEASTLNVCAWHALSECIGGRHKLLSQP